MKSLLRSLVWMGWMTAALGSWAAAQGTSRWTVAELTRRADKILAGEVMRIEWEGRTVAVTVRVDDGLRGVRAGEEVTIREWAALWEQGPERYRAGERLLLFLQTVRGGESDNPTGGAAGVMRIHGDGTVLLPDDVMAPRPARARRLEANLGPVRMVNYREMVRAIMAALGQS